MPEPSGSGVSIGSGWPFGDGRREGGCSGTVVGGFGGSLWGWRGAMFHVKTFDLAFSWIRRRRHLRASFSFLEALPWNFGSSPLLSSCGILQVKILDPVPAGSVDDDASNIVFPPWRHRLRAYDLPILIVAQAGSAATSGVDVAMS